MLEEVVMIRALKHRWDVDGPKLQGFRSECHRQRQGCKMCVCLKRQMVQYGGNIGCTERKEENKRKGGVGWGNF